MKRTVQQTGQYGKNVYPHGGSKNKRITIKYLLFLLNLQHSVQKMGCSTGG